MIWLCCAQLTLLIALTTEIWFYVFAWSFFSSIIIHVGAAGAAFASLRRHKIARYWPLLILVSGIITPICVSLITSEFRTRLTKLFKCLNSCLLTGALIAGVYRAAFFEMAPFYGLLFGVGQTLLTLVFAYTRILATL